VGACAICEWLWGVIAHCCWWVVDVVVHGGCSGEGVVMGTHRLVMFEGVVVVGACHPLSFEDGGGGGHLLLVVV